MSIFIEEKIWSKADCVYDPPRYPFWCDLYGLAPEHPFVHSITTEKQREHVEKYQKMTATKSDLDRTELNRQKTGVFTGAYAINPVNEQEIPIWISDYVLAGYGTGAIMAVPAHDDRDFEFAKSHDLPDPSCL